MKIAILAPMRQELAPVVQAFSLEKATIGGEVMRTGRIGETEIFATTTGIGTAGAKRATEQLLDAIPVDHVMVVGIAGGVGPTVKIGDLIYADIVIDKSTGTEYRPTHLGAPTARGTIVTSDDFLVEPGMVEELTAAGVIALDMETSAVAAVCESRGCAWSVIRDQRHGHGPPGRLGARPRVTRRLGERPGRRQVPAYEAMADPASRPAPARLEVRRDGGRERCRAAPAARPDPSPRLSAGARRCSDTA